MDENCRIALSLNTVHVKCEPSEEAAFKYTELTDSLTYSEDGNVQIDQNTPDMEEYSTVVVSSCTVNVKCEPIQEDISPYTELRNSFQTSEDVKFQTDQIIREMEEFSTVAPSSHIVNVKCEPTEGDISVYPELEKSFRVSEDVNVQTDQIIREMGEFSAVAPSSHIVNIKCEPIEEDTSPYTGLGNSFRASEDGNIQTHQSIPEMKEYCRVDTSPHFVCTKHELIEKDTSSYKELKDFFTHSEHDLNIREREEDCTVVPSPYFVRVECEPIEEDTSPYTDLEDTSPCAEFKGFFPHSKEFSEQNIKRLRSESSEWGHILQVASSSSQSLSVEAMAVKSQKPISRSFCPVVPSSLEYQKRFGAASFSTAEEATDTYLSKGHAKQLMVGSAHSEGRSGVDQQETHFQRAKLGSDSLMISIDERRFKCSQCGKSFKRKDHLNAHIRIHTGHQPYKCYYCGHSFTQSGHLTSHLRQHTGEKPYKCHQCGITFAHSNSLTMHMRRHTGDQPYKCTQCGQSYIDSTQLTRHMRQHS